MSEEREPAPGPAFSDVFVPHEAADLLDAVAGVGRTIAALEGARARMIDQAFAWVRENQRALRGARADDRLSRDILVSELAALLRIASGSAARLVDESRALVADLPATLTALGRGEISYDHASVVVDNAGSLPEAARGAYEVAVLNDAVKLNVPRFRDRADRKSVV